MVWTEKIIVFAVMWVTDHASTEPSNAAEKELGRGKSCPLEPGQPCTCSTESVKGMNQTHFEYFLLHILGTSIIEGMVLILDLASFHYTAAIFAAAFLLKLWLAHLPAKCSISKVLRRKLKNITIGSFEKLVPWIIANSVLFVQHS